MKFRRIVLGYLGLACVVAASTAAPVAAGGGEVRTEARVVYVVRHAEKTAGDDPVLTEQGIRRSETLAAMLQAASVHEVWVTNTRRSRLTGEPLAAESGAKVNVYEPFASDTLLEAARALPAGGAMLVVAHSNTVPKLVSDLSGEPIPEIADDEYDWLYGIVFVGDEVAVVPLRF